MCEVSRDGVRVGREDVGVAASGASLNTAYPRRSMRPPVYRLFARSSRGTTTADLRDGPRRLGEPLVRPLPCVCVFPVTAQRILQASLKVFRPSLATNREQNVENQSQPGASRVPNCICVTWLLYHEDMCRTPVRVTGSNLQWP